MKTTPFFSIIIPAYNAQNTILQCVYSALRQNFTNYEIIIINDGSTDSTEKTIDPLLVNKKIHYYYKKNGGVSSARNLGIKKSSGKWIIFLDADDTLSKNALETINEILHQNDADFIISPVLPRQKSTRESKKLFYIDKKNVINGLIYNLPSAQYFIPRCPGGKIIKKDLIEKNKLSFNEELKIFEDGIFNLFASHYSNKILYLNFIFYNYTENNPASRMNNFYPEIVDDNLLIYKIIHDFIEETNIESKNFAYLCFELFSTSIFAVSRIKTKIKTKIAYIKKYAKIYSKHFNKRIRIKELSIILKIEYILFCAKMYRVLLAFCTIKFHLKHNRGRA